MIATLRSGAQKHSTPARGHRVRRQFRQGIEGYLFILPWLIGFLTFGVGPVISSLFLSFTTWTVFGIPKPVGWQNYVEIFTNDPRLVQSLRVTLTYVIFATPLHQVIALLLAVLLNVDVKGRNIFRTIFYLPAVVSGVAVAIIWMWVFQPEFGLVNAFLKAVLGIRGPSWFASETWALPTIIIMNAWGVGGGMVIYLAALQGVPKHLYEAAELDGAGAVRQFWHITLAMISPSIFFNLTMGIIGGFQTFTAAYITTQGGPMDATLFYSLYLYQNAFQYMRMGYASAMAWVLFLIILAVTLVQFWTSKRWVYYEGGLG